MAAVKRRSSLSIGFSTVCKLVIDFCRDALVKLNNVGRFV
jgi:hypothetical protein